MVLNKSLYKPPNDVQERLQEKNTKIRFPTSGGKMTGNTLEKIRLLIKTKTKIKSLAADSTVVNRERGRGRRGGRLVVTVSSEPTAAHAHTLTHTHSSILALNKHLSSPECSQVAVAGGRQPGEDKIAPV